MLSVIIAAFNAEQVLPSQLRALAAQRAPVGSWEVVVCDNGSTDGTAQVAREFGSGLPNLRVIDAGQRPGPAHARNRGAEVARGSHLAFCDADDVAANDWLEEIMLALSRHDFVAGSFESHRLNDARTLRSRPLDQQHGLQWTPGHPLPHAGAGNLGIRRELFLQLGGFNEHILRLEDTDLCWRVQLTGVPLVFVPEVRMHVRLRSSWRGIFAQGRGYGSAERLLERRYPAESRRDRAAGLAGVGRGPGAGPAPVGQPHEGGPAPAAHHTHSFTELLWQLGWSSGHRWPQPWARRSIPQPDPLPDRAYPA